MTLSIGTVWPEQTVDPDQVLQIDLDLQSVQQFLDTSIGSKRHFQI